MAVGRPLRVRATSMLCLVASLVCALPSGAAAQDASTASQAQAPPRLRPDQAIWVTTADGRELQGRVRLVSPSTLEMIGPTSELTIPLDDVRVIEARDSLKDGARSGAIIGGVSLGIYFGLLSHGLRCERDCGAGYSATRDTLGAVAFGMMVGAGAGALGGLLIDHLVEGREVVYSAPSTTSTSWKIYPMVAEHGVGMRATMRW